MLLFLIAPILVIMPLSFNSESYFSYPMPGLSLRWYEDFFTNDRWALALKNSIIVARCRDHIRDRRSARSPRSASAGRTSRRATSIMSVLISPMIVPVIISAVGMYFFYTRIGLSNSLPGLILAHTALATPFVVIVVTATLSGFDHTLDPRRRQPGRRPPSGCSSRSSCRSSCRA